MQPIDGICLDQNPPFPFYANSPSLFSHRAVARNDLPKRNRSIEGAWIGALSFKVVQVKHNHSLKEHPIHSGNCY